MLQIITKILKLSNNVQSCFVLSEITFIKLNTNSKWLKLTQAPCKRYRAVTLVLNNARFDYAYTPKIQTRHYYLQKSHQRNSNGSSTILCVQFAASPRYLKSP